VLHIAASCLRIQELPPNRRVSVGLSAGEYKELSALAEELNVSMAWLSRKAIVEFLQDSRTHELQLTLGPLRPTGKIEQ